MNILVGYDGSHASQQTLTLARQHAKVMGAKIFVVSASVRQKDPGTAQLC